MGFFTKHKAKEEMQTPEPSIAERIQEAERAITEADTRATAIAKNLYDLQCRHNLTLDNFGSITACSKIGGATEDDLAQQVRALVEARTSALQQFHAALNIWAGLKGAVECK